MTQTIDLAHLNEAVKMMKTEEIDSFSSKIMHVCNACNDADPEGGDGSHLPPGFSVVNAYTEVTTGSRCVAVIVKILKTIPITIVKGIKVTQLVAVNAVPPVEVTSKLWKS